jgi:hypothetical protein
MNAEKTTPRIIRNFDWISVDFGNGRRLTAGRSGEKATGAVPRDVFDKWSKMICETGTGTFDERIERFVADIDTTWPDWNKPPRSFAVGEQVKFDFGKRRGGVRTGTVIKVLRTNYTVDFGDMGRIRMAGDLLAEFN